MTSQYELIEQFLRAKRIAIVGVSRNPSDFTRALWKDFRKRGYDAVPVNPHLSDIDGIPCFSSVKNVSPVAEGALVMVGKSDVATAIAECAAAGVGLLWVYGIRGEKDVPPEIIAQCREAGIQLIAGHCPYMFLNDSAWFHRLHRFGWKMMGYYPS